MSKFTKVNVAGDGSCYFHAVTGFLEMERLIKNNKTYYKKGNATDLRKKVVNWLRNHTNFKYPNGLTIKDDIEDELQNNPNLHSLSDYLQYMSKESAYAGQIEITATANLLKRSIRVYIIKNGNYRGVGLGYQINNSKEDDITLFHNMKPGRSKGDHFEILFPTSKAQVVTKTMYDKLNFKNMYKMRRTVRAKRGKRTKRGKWTKRIKRNRTNIRRNTMRRKSIKRNNIKRNNIKRKTIRRRNNRRKKRYLGGAPHRENLPRDIIRSALIEHHNCYLGPVPLDAEGLPRYNAPPTDEAAVGIAAIENLLGSYRVFDDDEMIYFIKNSNINEDDGTGQVLKKIDSQLRTHYPHVDYPRIRNQVLGRNSIGDNLDRRAEVMALLSQLPAPAASNDDPQARFDALQIPGQAVELQAPATEPAPAELAIPHLDELQARLDARSASPPPRASPRPAEDTFDDLQARIVAMRASSNPQPQHVAPASSGASSPTATEDDVQAEPGFEEFDYNPELEGRGQFYEDGLSASA